MVEPSIVFGFAAGLLSFLSPCVLPLVPAFLAYLAGTSLEEDELDRRRILLHTALFVAGFATMFAVLGVVLNASLQALNYPVQQWLSRVAGILIIVFGLHLTGVIRVDLFDRSLNVGTHRMAPGYVASFLFGAAFAVGWTPCVGPLLGSTFALAATQPVTAFTVLMAYAAGMGLPFLVVGMFPRRTVGLVRGGGRYTQQLHVLFGGILIFIGMLVFTGQLTRISMIPFLGGLIA